MNFKSLHFNSTMKQFIFFFGLLSVVLGSSPKQSLILFSEVDTKIVADIPMENLINLPVRLGNTNSTNLQAFAEIIHMLHWELTTYFAHLTPDVGHVPTYDCPDDAAVEHRLGQYMNQNGIFLSSILSNHLEAEYKCMKSIFTISFVDLKIWDALECYTSNQFYDLLDSLRAGQKARLLDFVDYLVNSMGCKRVH